MTSTSSIFDHTVGNRFFPQLLSSTNNGANKIFKANQDSLREIATHLAADENLANTVSDLVEQFEDDAKRKTVDNYFEDLSSSLSKAKDNVKKFFNFIKDNSKAFKIPEDLVKKINNLLGNNNNQIDLPFVS